MESYKAVATITWVFDSNCTREENLDRARKTLESILDCNPEGEDFNEFNVQVDIAKMKVAYPFSTFSC